MKKEASGVGYGAGPDLDRQLSGYHNYQAEREHLEMQGEGLLGSAFMASPYAAVILDWRGVVLACNRRAAQAWFQTSATEATSLVGVDFAEVSSLPPEETLARVREAFTTGVTSIPIIKKIAGPDALETRLRACLLESTLHGNYRILLSQDVLSSTVKAFTSLNRHKNLAKQQIQKLAKKSEHLEQSLEAARIFTNAASHDLRGPLGSLTALLGRFDAQYADDLPEKGKTFVKHMQSSADRLQELTLCLLDYATAHSGQISLEPVGIYEVLTSVRVEMQPKLREAFGTMNISPTPLEIPAQKLLFRNLISNLVGNAIKFRAPNRPLIITAGAEVSKEGDIILTVADTGCGFSQADAERIFQPFERLSSSVAGSGIGLATCAEICKRHGWTISARGDVTKGAEFTIRIPLCEPLG